ncbi:MSCRAMM family protein [Gordonia hydrophobica]|uniref:Prealbumin-like fold domain-containing protein n=1 Tax=Gordonia hydrophobica TaxID=40516 RepID=A0ABZ2U2A4_9ACTN|nr:prealbumin-like fold domain-containing protein [Gordonia hydrophobica]MBM7369156.1 hypothetical protein [Gordonia hydrophobica]
MSKHVTRLLFAVAALLVAVAAAVAMSAPPAVAEPAPPSTTQVDTTVTPGPAPGTTTPSQDTGTPTTSPPDETGPSTPAETTTTTEPPPTSTEPPVQVGEVTVTAIDRKTATPVDGVTVSLRVDDTNTAVTTPSTTTMPAGTVTATVTGIPEGYNWANAEPSSVELTAGGRAAIVVKLGRPDLRGAISITKRDRITGAPLAGARYRLAPCQGAVGAIIVTGRDGVGTQWIRHGCYLLKEIEAPAGYRLDPTERTVTLVPTEVLRLTLYDLPNAPVVIVRNPGNRVPLTSIPTGRTS